MSGLAFAEMGAGDLGLAMGYKQVPRKPFPPDTQRVRGRVFRPCEGNELAILEGSASNGDQEDRLGGADRRRRPGGDGLGRHLA